MTNLEIAAANLATALSKYETARIAADHAARRTRQFVAEIERRKRLEGEDFRPLAIGEARRRRRIAKACGLARRLERMAWLEVNRCERLLDAAVNSDSVAL